MADITRVHGNAQPQGQTGSISADALLVNNGPDLEFFKIIVKDVSGNVEDLRGELDVNEGVAAILTEIQKSSQIEMYQVEGDTSGQISVALRAGAFTATTLQTAIRTLTAAGTNNLDCSSSDVTNPGFELV
jgi:hypothetical protein|tara:strand:- start:371 stop:763 length:393 start_codon:yes stop_codon:yes gene_type:complete